MERLLWFMRFPRLPVAFLRVKRSLAGAVAGVMLASAAGVQAAPERLASVGLSPVPENVGSLGQAWRIAESFVAAHERCDVFVGRGDSMLPLYRDRTVLVVQTMPVADLQAGMTVVFVGDHGQLVAHQLLEKTSRGWRAMGAGNLEADRTPVTRGNLMGVVVRAYATDSHASRLAAQ